MELYTIQLGRWRQAQALRLTLVDTTVKTGALAFAPSWEMVWGHKNGTLSDAAYTELYYARMRVSYVAQRPAWEQLLQLERPAVACYCARGRFCHRHLLVDIVGLICQARGIAFSRGGEVGG